MKAAVYNRYWASMGGGERHGGRLAQVLAEDGWQVDLLGPAEVDLDDLGMHLGLDLRGVRLRVVPERGDAGLAAVTEDYDLLVNASYMSRLAARAKRNVYLCYFPTPADHDLTRLQRWLIRRVGTRVSGWQMPFEHGIGWFPAEGGRRRTYTWTSGDGVLVIPEGTDPVIRADFARVGFPAETILRVVDEAGAELASFPVGPQFNRQVVRVADRGPITVHLVSEATVPGPSDNRTLGVAVSRMRIGNRISPRQWVGYRLPWLLRDPTNVSFLTSYDRVLANSEYTRGWIRRRWDVDADVLFPPIALDPLEPAEVREPVIASVGRFFGPQFGHSKRQLEMVRFFGELVGSGRLRGWRMRIIGGCEPAQQPYLDQVQAAARGLPVDIRVNAPRAEVEELLASASIFWSATGLGEDEERRPWTSEHFGITTVEAMSGGCVPIVIDRAGQREIVRDGVEGYRWTTAGELAARTLEVAGDPVAQRRLARAARIRAEEFSEEAFAARWRAIAADLGLTPR
ncbi:MAG TPA: glycosyltransferase [Mycobacteriales bacterium]|nr:glycosyltransferase [Mycobacteriales bacterium]